MRKFISLIFIISALLAALAFRMISAGLTNTSKDFFRRIALKKKFIISCRSSAAYDIIPGDIPPLPGCGNHSWKITTGSDSAQFYFNQGINMYYAFHTLEAQASFAKAIRFDSSCAMAWYGQALALGPTINFGNGFRAPEEAVLDIDHGERLNSGCTDLEKDLIAAMRKRYSKDTTIDLKKLQDDYAASMKILADKYSGNADIVALYADALMLEHPWDLYDIKLQPKPWTNEIRRVLAKALVLDSLHPGANHFMVHTVEGSLHPEDGLKNAEILAGLMPDVAHIVHMPSHIYIRTGNYKKGIESNYKAVDAYHKYLGLYAPEAEGMFLYDIHAIHLQSACSMMAGNYRVAMSSGDALNLSVTDEFQKTPGATGNFMQYAKNFQVFTLLRFGKWEAVIKEPVPDTALHFATVIRHFARGMAFAGLSLTDSAKQEKLLLEKAMKANDLKIPFDPFSSAFDAGQVADGILAGKIAETSGDLILARRNFELAVQAEDMLVYDEPRDWPIPARQYLGSLFLKMKQYENAILVFQKDLEVNPNNGWSLTGLELAYQVLNNQVAVKKIKARLTDAWQVKDVPIKSPVF
jgi:tetratricopeptide (TPR) repeat protein